MPCNAGPANRNDGVGGWRAPVKAGRRPQIGAALMGPVIVRWDPERGAGLAGSWTDVLVCEASRKAGLRGGGANKPRSATGLPIATMPAATPTTTIASCQRTTKAITFATTARRFPAYPKAREKLGNIGATVSLWSAHTLARLIRPCSRWSVRAQIPIPSGVATTWLRQARRTWQPTSIALAAPTASSLSANHIRCSLAQAGEQPSPRQALGEV